MFLRKEINAMLLHCSLFGRLSQFFKQIFFPGYITLDDVAESRVSFSHHTRKLW